MLSGNTAGSIKCPYFDTIILPTLKKVKRFQTRKIDGAFFRNLDPHNSTRHNTNVTLVAPKIKESLDFRSNFNFITKKNWKACEIWVVDAGYL